MSSISGDVSCNVYFLAIFWFYLEDHNAPCVSGGTVQFITPVITRFFQFSWEELDVYINCQGKPSGLCDHFLLLHTLLAAWLPVLINLHNIKSYDLIHCKEELLEFYLIFCGNWPVLPSDLTFSLSFFNFRHFSTVVLGTARRKFECVGALTSNQSVDSTQLYLFIADMFLSTPGTGWRELLRAERWAVQMAIAFLVCDGLEKLLCIQCYFDTPMIYSTYSFSVKTCL